MKLETMDRFSYNSYGQNMTGFNNSIDHLLFGYWSNPEYQELCQDFDFEMYESIIISINQAYDNYVDYLSN